MIVINIDWTSWIAFVKYKEESYLKDMPYIWKKTVHRIKFHAYAHWKKKHDGIICNGWSKLLGPRGSYGVMADLNRDL